jgi:hypothetical protein
VLSLAKALVCFNRVQLLINPSEVLLADIANWFWTGSVMSPMVVALASVIEKVKVSMSFVHHLPLMQNAQLQKRKASNQSIFLLSASSSTSLPPVPTSQTTCT